MVTKMSETFGVSEWFLYIYIHICPDICKIFVNRIYKCILHTYYVYIHLYTCNLMHCIYIILYMLYIYISLSRWVIDRQHLLNPADLTGHASRGTKNSRTDADVRECESHTHARSSTGSMWDFSVSVCGGGFLFLFISGWFFQIPAFLVLGEYR